MNTSLIILIALHSVSLLFALITMSRLYDYIRHHRFGESKYTLLLGFVHLRWIALGYFFIGIIWAVGSFIFYLTLDI